MNTVKPLLTKELPPEVFKEYYWEKKELVHFCTNHKLPSAGGKLELSTRIENFLRTGKIDKVVNKKRKYKFDSQEIITSSTKVVNFKCDAKTREFFIREIGQHFKFNDYLRQFIKTPDLDGSLTYGHLVAGWLANESDIKQTTQKPPIAKQFQFNQFQRDFYNANKNAKREEMLKAWKLVRSVAGPATYENYQRGKKC